MDALRQYWFAKSYSAAMRRLEAGWLGVQRRELLAQAYGKVLEVGAGSGANLELYPLSVTDLFLTEPTTAMYSKLLDLMELHGHPRLRLAQMSAEYLSYGDNTFDCVVATLVLCSVKNPTKCLSEIHRVLRPGGQFLFLEHVRDEDPRVVRWQRFMEPFSRFFGYNCHLTRDSEVAIRATGFASVDAEIRLAPKAPVFERRFLFGRATK